MISFWHLTAACCIPSPNPELRLREQEIFRKVAADQAEFTRPEFSKPSHGRWDQDKKDKTRKATVKV